MAKVLPRMFIKFPSGPALQQTMADFAELGMEGCAGAIDGCFMPMITPTGPYGHKYWCYTNLHYTNVIRVSSERDQSLIIRLTCQDCSADRTLCCLKDGFDTLFPLPLAEEGAEEGEVWKCPLP